MKKNVSIQGINTMPNHKDGECLQIVNARWKKGALRPVVPAGEKRKLKTLYDILFIHRLPNGTDENYIGITSHPTPTSPLNPPQGDFETTIIWDKGEGDFVEIVSLTNINIYSIEQTGNILVFITDTDRLYAIWKENNYEWLGKVPELPIIEFAATKASHNLTYSNDFLSIDTKGQSSGSAEGLVPPEIYTGVYNKLKHELEIRLNSILLDQSCLLRYAYRLYDGTTIYPSCPFLFIRNKLIVDDFLTLTVFAQDYVMVSYTVGGFYVIKYAYNFNNLVKWKDIISSVDIFMSSPLTNFPFDSTLIAETKIASCGNFYLVRRIEDFDKGDVVSQFPFLDLSKEELVKRSDYLVDSELLKDDSEFHRQGASKTMQYNKRTHQWNLQSVLFKGWSPYMMQVHNLDWGGAGFSLPMIVFAVELNINGDKKTVYNVSHRDEYVNKVNPTLTIFDSQGRMRVWLYGFLSYPDSRAKKLTIYNCNDLSDAQWRKYAEYKLTPSLVLNLAYYFQSGVISVGGTSSNLFSNVPRPDYSQEDIIIINNETLVVSETNNPFLFPAANSYDFDNKILWVASNKLAVTDRSFGQFPLYIGTEGGIYLLQVSSDPELAYSKIITPTTHSLPISELCETTPYGVAYITEKGVQLINGQEIINISAPLELKSPRNSIQTDVTSRMPIHTDYDFVEYCKGATDICYNIYEDELIVIQKHATICFIYSFGAKMWYQSTLQYDIRAKNSYPEILVARNNILKSLSKKDGTKGNVSIITRPIYFGIDEVKNMQRAIVRGKFINKSPAQPDPEPSNFPILAGVMASNDGEAQQLLRGMVLKDGAKNKDYKDFDLGLMARAKARNYSIVISGRFDEQTEIQYIDFEVNDNYGNDKMR